MKLTSTLVSPQEITSVRPSQHLEYPCLLRPTQPDGSEKHGALVIATDSLHGTSIRGDETYATGIHAGCPVPWEMAVELGIWELVTGAVCLRFVQS